MDPDVATNYYSRTDQLLVVLYNKINHSKRASDNLEKPHTNKNWRSEYKVMPNFTTWLKSYNKFIHPVADFQPKDNHDAQVKFNFD